LTGEVVSSATYGTLEVEVVPFLQLATPLDIFQVPAVVGWAWGVHCSTSPKKKRVERAALSQPRSQGSILAVSKPLETKLPEEGCRWTTQGSSAWACPQGQPQLKCVDRGGRVLTNRLTCKNLGKRRLLSMPMRMCRISNIDNNWQRRITSPME